jgi:nucleotide-binding universal stress UspA family protein
MLVLLGVLIECPIFLWIYFDNQADLEGARTRIFLLFIFVELIISVSFRSLRYSLFQAPPHKWLLLAIGWELGLFAVLVQFAAVRETFGIRMPTWPDLAMALAVSAFVVAAIEATKAFLRATPSGRVAPQDAGTVSSSMAITGANTMRRILIPVGGTRNDVFAAQAVIKRFMNDTAIEVHLVNVQMPFSADVARFSSRRSRHDYHREQSEQALAPVKEMLDRHSIPYAVHMAVGDRAKVITDTARRLRCDEIVMATARKNSLTRLVESSVTDQVVALTPVPVEIIAGNSMSKWEQYGIPAAIATGLAMVLAIED